MLFEKGDEIKSLRNIAAGNGTLFLAGTVFIVKETYEHELGGYCLQSKEESGKYLGVRSDIMNKSFRKV